MVVATEVLKCDPKSPLAESGFTAEWLVDALLKLNTEFKKALGSGKVTEITATDISDGEGYVSRVYKTTLNLSGATSEEYSVIMKVPTRAKLDKLSKDLGDEIGDNMVGVKEVWDKLDVSDVHDIECTFYEAVNGIKDFPLPKVWLAERTGENSPGVILMEDLSVVGCKTGWTLAMTSQQLRNICRHFATLHAYQLSADEDRRKKIETVQLKSKLFDEFSEGVFENFMKAVPEAQEGELKELTDKIRKTLSKGYLEFAIFERPIALGVPPLLLQGDSGGHNIMFKRAEDGTVANEVCALIDWQIAFRGNPFYDIANYVVACSDAEVRRELEVDLVEDYYTHLKTAVEKNGKTLSFGVEQLRELYALAVIRSSTAPLAFLCFLPIILKDKAAPGVLEALREKTLLRAKFALLDAVELAKKYAPQFLTE